MSKPNAQSLRIADDGIVAALAAIGEALPATLRAALITTSDWCWLRRVDAAGPYIIGGDHAAKTSRPTNAEQLAAAMARILRAEIDRHYSLKYETEIEAAEREYDALFERLFGVAGFPSPAFDADYRTALAAHGITRDETYVGVMAGGERAA
jgi:hypothetical protein